MVSFYKADLDDLLVVLDDIALPLGALRMRAVGSAGGHNGLADVLMHLGSQEVPRLRIGVGAPLENMDAADFVLGPFGSDETEIIERAVNLAARAVEDWVFSGIDYVMDNYNQKVEPQDPKIRDTRQ
jgi:PTH1 family peptidyl-tRNA hydrolase